MSKGLKVVFVAFTQHCIQSNFTHLAHVERVKSGVCGLYTQYRYIKCYVKRVKRLCYVKTRDNHIFAHNFLNI